MKRVFTMVVVLAALGACSETKQPAEDWLQQKEIKSSKQQRRSGIARGERELARAVELTVEGCRISRWGFVKEGSCKDSALESLVDQIEQKTGADAAIMTYCRGLHDKRKNIGALSSFRIGDIATNQARARAVSKVSLECLLKAVPTVRDLRFRRRVAKSAILIGTLLDQEHVVLQDLPAAKMPSARAAAYGALWTYGRLSALTRIKQALGSAEPLEVQRAALRGFGTGVPLSAVEAAEVCGYLLTLLDHQNTVLAGESAYRAATLCSNAEERVVSAAERLVKEKRFSFEYTNALIALSRKRAEAQPTRQKTRLIRILERVVGGRRDFPERLRAAALRAVFLIDEREGKRLAEKCSDDPSSVMKQVAQAVLPHTRLRRPE